MVFFKMLLLLFYEIGVAAFNFEMVTHFSDYTSNLYRKHFEKHFKLKIKFYGIIKLSYLLDVLNRYFR